MQNWQKHRNFKKHENADGSFTYTITVDGETLEVSEEIYTTYAQGGYKMENMEFGFKYDRVLKGADGKAVRDDNGQAVILPEREVSLDRLIDEDWEYPSSGPSTEDTVLGQLDVEALYSCLDLLAVGERELITALFFNGLTEREYAGKLGISKTALHARKNKVLAKLKIFLNQ